MAENLIANGNFWDGFNGYTKGDISYELKTYDGFFDYCEFKGNGQSWNRFYTYFKDGTKFVTGKTYRIGFWGRSDNSNSINIGCNDDPLTFSLTPQWKWYESEYVSTLDQAVSIINPDTTNTVCISGIWIQLGNDPIIPEVSPYIQTIELGNNQINLDSSQIEQGGSVGGAFGVDYSTLKNSSSNNLFFIRLRSRNLYEIPTANREVEITGDFTGFQLYVTEYDSEKKSIAYNGWHDNFKLKVRNDTRYISLLIRNSSDSTITPSQFITRGGVLVMSDYPTLPIVTTPDGFEYAEGYNLLSVSKALLTEIGTDRSAFQISKTISEGGFDLTVNKDTTGLAAVRFQWLYLPYALTTYRITYEAWAGAPSGSPKIRCNNDICDANPHGVEITAIRTKFTSTHYPSKQYIFDNVSRGFTDFEIAGVGSALKAGTKIHVRNITLTLGQTEFDYRPNPADMVCGGLPMSIIARGLPLTVRNSIDEAIQNTASQLEQRLSTSIAQTGESIKNEVSQQYYAKGDTDKLIAEASTILTQKYNSFEMSFNSFKQMVDSSQNLTNQEFATITKFIRFIDGNIFLGENGNNQMLKIAKDRISFLQGQAEVAYISDSTLYIYDGVFLNSLRIGNFAFVPRANGSLDFKKVR